MIQLQDVTKRYGDALALKGISTEIRKGEIVGFLGPNGAGKTTTMKLITGYLAPTSGTITVDGLDVLKDSVEVRRRIGYLPENAPVYTDMIVSEYLAFMGEARGLSGAALSEAIRRVAGLCGLSARLGQSIGALSKGYRQRVGLAQALIHDPPILVLDEPTTGLDPNQIVEIRSMIKEIGAQKTVILSTHILPEVEATTDRVLIISDGKLVADGTTEEIKATQGGGRISLQVEATEPVDAVVKAASAVPGVRAARVIGGEGGVHRLSLGVDGGADVSRALFRLAVSKGWILLEMHREAAGLEAIFQSLTGAQSPAQEG